VKFPREVRGAAVLPWMRLDVNVERGMEIGRLTGAEEDSVSICSSWYKVRQLERKGRKKRRGTLKRDTLFLLRPLASVDGVSILFC
jgi:hypothetical protein